MGNNKWKFEKQPAWIVNAIRKTITALPGGYDEAAEILGVGKSTLFNRLRTDGDQIFPPGWAMVLQQATGSTHIADAVSRNSNSVNVPLVDPGDVDNGDINDRLLESIELIGRHSQFIRRAEAVGVIDEKERDKINENSYLVMTKWQEHLTLLYRVYCPPERMNAPDCSLRRSDAAECGEFTA
ncbi:DNA-binding protein [Erwinia endophytica]|uniref:YmfL family putative regulatory protein n=1 Tax=Erwinia endophytica TaxID=1563158 RepID=UPI0012660590|nr:YmfL family putative regulatory protein [Erwinia endophytica]KAB8312270.1 DNA-binding protein [Erwinia endophytica]